MKYIKYFERTDKDIFRDVLLWLYMRDDYSVQEYLRFLNDNVNFINRMRKKNEFICKVIFRFSTCMNYKHIFVRNSDLLIKITSLLDLLNKYKFEDIDSMIGYIVPQYYSDEKVNITERRKFFEDLFLYFINKFPETIKILNDFEILKYNGKKINLESENNTYDMKVNLDINIKFAKFLINSEISKYLDEKIITKLKNDIEHIELYRSMSKYNI